MAFKPEEIIYSPTSLCNLNCPHCTVKRNKAGLSVKKAVRFLKSAKKSGIERITISGGEPFLKPGFLYEILKNATENGMLFNRIMTNGVWYKNKQELNNVLTKLLNLGFCGEICLSVDVFHKQDPDKLELFIRTAATIFNRADIISIAYVSGAKEKLTYNKLSDLATMLKARIYNFGKNHAYLKAKDLFVKLIKIDISPIGNSCVLKDPWDGPWFKEDHCKGPGNVFFVMANGDVSPCCGYANEERLLKIGNIYRDTPASIMKNAERNLFIKAVFNKGLSAVRNKLIRLGIKFPGKTSNNCYFCWYLQHSIPPATLNSVLQKI